MSVSVDQLPADMVSVLDGRWQFQLSERLNGHLGGASLVEGRTVEPVSNAVLKRFICGHGHVMIGALRVVGPPAELGDCTDLRAKAEPEPAPAMASQTVSAPEPEPEPLPPEPEPVATTTRKGKRW